MGSQVAKLGVTAVVAVSVAIIIAVRARMEANENNERMAVRVPQAEQFGEEAYAKRQAEETARQEEAKRQAEERARQKEAKRQAEESTRREEAKRQAVERARHEWEARAECERILQQQTERLIRETVERKEAFARQTRQKEAEILAEERARKEGKRISEEKDMQEENRLAEERDMQEKKRQDEERDMMEQESQRLSEERAQNDQDQKAPKEAHEKARQKRKAKKQKQDLARQKATQRQIESKDKQEKEDRKQAEEQALHAPATRRTRQRANKKEAKQEVSGRPDHGSAGQEGTEILSELIREGWQIFIRGWQAERNDQTKEANKNFQGAFEKFDVACKADHNNALSRKGRELSSLKMIGNNLFNEGVKLQQRGNNSDADSKDCYIAAKDMFEEAKIVFEEGWKKSKDRGFKESISVAEESMRAAVELINLVGHVRHEKREIEIRTEREVCGDIITVIEKKK